MKFFAKFDAEKTDDRLYPNILGKILVVGGWVLIYGVVFSLSHNYFNTGYRDKVWTETVKNFKDNYLQ